MTVFIYIAILILFLTKNGEGKTFTIGKSKIHGRGVIVNQSIKRGEIVALAITNSGKVTKGVGNWVNHCNNNPTGYLFQFPHNDDNSVWLLAKKDLKQGDEITIDYNERVVIITTTEIKIRLLTPPRKNFIRC